MRLTDDLRHLVKRLVPIGKGVQVYLRVKSLERRQMGALNGRTKFGVVLGYGIQSRSYGVFVEGTVRSDRSIYTLRLPTRWSFERFQEATTTRKDQHNPHVARAIPFVPRDGVQE